MQLQQAVEAKTAKCKALRERLRGDSLTALQREVELLKTRVDRAEVLAVQQ